jgi:hypothetical protein
MEGDCRLRTATGIIYGVAISLLLWAVIAGLVIGIEWALIALGAIRCMQASTDADRGVWL